MELTREDIFYALEAGGVGNWSGYEYAQELAEEDGLDWNSLDPEDMLTYLEYAGVDNWSYYDESIEYYEANL